MSFPRRARDLRRTAAHVLIGTLTLPIGFLESVSTVPQALAADQQLLISEVQPSGNGFVELVNAGTDAVSLSGWSLWSQSSGEIETLTGNLAAQERRVIETRKLDDRGDHVTLRSGASTIAHYLEYGETATAAVMSPERDQSISWVGTLGFVTNTTPTPGSTNQTPALVSAATSAGIAASSDNPAHAVNDATEHDAVVEATLPLGSTWLTALLIDEQGRTVTNTIATQGATTARVPMRASSLADGQLTVRTAITTAGGAVMPWTTGTQARKDTEAPEKPVVTTPTHDVTVTSNTATVSGTAEANTTVSVWQDAAVLATATSNGEFTIVAPLQPGKNDFTVRTTDWAGNASRTASVPTITSTSLTPGAVPAPLKLRARVLSESRVQLTWELSSEAQVGVHHFSLYGDDRTGTVNLAHPIGQVASNERSFTTMSLPKGTHRFTVRSVNERGDQSLNTDTASATVAGFQFETSLDGGSQLIDFRPDQPVSLQTSSATTNRGQVSVESLGMMNPSGTTLTERSVGKYFEILSTNTTVFPLEIRLYYTTQDLAAASIGNERQLTGIRFFDAASRTWKSFEQTGVNTVDVMANGTAYAGYFYAVTTHLTTVVGVADLTDPGVPEKLTGEAGDRRVKLTWQAPSDATGYWIRYRKATNIDTVPYTTVFVSGTNQTNYLVSNLTNGTLYEFGVAAEDAVGNTSDFAVIEQTPTASAPTTDFITPATARLTSTTTTTTVAEAGTGSTTTSQPEGTTSDGTEESTDDEGDVRGGTDSQDGTQSARSLVTLLIVLVAAAAGFGGYYGYQWWTARPEDFDEPEPIRTEEQPPKKPERAEKPEKGDRPGGRW